LSNNGTKVCQQKRVIVTNIYEVHSMNIHTLQNAGW